MSEAFLHVANGHSTTGTIREAGIPGLLSIWADPLHEGPVPGDVSDEELIDVRARHLASELSPGPSATDIAHELRQWRAAIEDDDGYGELVLWFEHDLFDQLNLIQALDWIGRRRPLAKPVSLICIDSFPGHPQFKGLGELTASRAGVALSARKRDQRCAIRSGRAGVAGVSVARSARARRLRSWRHGRVAVSRAGVDAASRGIPVDARRAVPHRTPALVVAAAGYLDIWKAFVSLHEDETAFYIADGSFWAIAEALAAAQPPLASIEITSREPGRLPSGTMALTDIGRSILGGHADRVSECGFDRWFGGVHLTTPGRIARWDHAQGRIVAAEEIGRR